MSKKIIGVTVGTPIGPEKIKEKINLQTAVKEAVGTALQDAKGAAAKEVSGHNTSDAAHSDIRLLITNLTTRLNTLANSEDVDLDQMAELVAYIKDNRGLIEQITTGKVGVNDIVNNLTTNTANKPLSAAQGVALKALIDAITVPTKVSQLINDKGYLTEYTETDPTVPAWAKAATKPSYSKSEVGLGNVADERQYSANNPPPYPVTSVNGQTGAVEVDVPAVVQTTGKSTTDVMSQKAVTEKLSQLSDDKVDKNQGVANVGKIFVVGADGNVTLTDMPSGTSGDVIGMIDANNNIVITGDLADGTYVFKYENADGTYAEIGSLVVGGAKYTNVLPLAQEYASTAPYVGSDGSIGYGNNMRFSSSSASATYMKEQTGVDTTAMIPVKRGDVLRFKNCNFKVTPSNTSYGSVTALFTASKALATGSNSAYNHLQNRFPMVVDGDEYVQMTIEPLSSWTNVDADTWAYIMISTDGLDETSIITINEEITD